ncbi:MAG: lysophospholipid acyltransferase family protein, partial [Candidatus Krumholzibacteriia bacterium]
ARPVLLVSRSADGEVLISALAPHGFGFARGSTGRGGGPAFRQLLAALREGRSVGVAVDGPRGPFGEVREGVVQLSRLSGRPVVPLRARPRCCWRLRTWDGTLVPWPGAAARVDEGAPLQVPPAEDPARTSDWSARIAAALTEGR